MFKSRKLLIIIQIYIFNYIYSNMYLYNLSLQQSTAITQAIYGNFTAPKAQEIVVSKGTILELYQIDDK